MPSRFTITLLFLICVFAGGLKGQGDAVLNKVVYNGFLTLNGKSTASFSDATSSSTFWLETGQSRYGITLEEIGENGDWVKISNGEAFRKVDFAKPEIIDPLTYYRMKTPSGVAGLSIQEKIEEQKQADRLEMDLMVSFQLDKERRERVAAERRR